METVKKSIMAGIFISVGGFVCLACTVKGSAFLGAFLFAIGLFAICANGFFLYTGKVGYIVENPKSVPTVLVILLVNVASTFLIGMLASVTFPELKEAAVNMFSKKMTIPFVSLLFRSFLCGLLMFLAVDTWKNGHKIGVFICVPVFILAGFEHSIADSFYGGIYMASIELSAKTILRYIHVNVIIIIGNALGGVLIPLMKKNPKEN